MLWRRTERVGKLKRSHGYTRREKKSPAEFYTLPMTVTWSDFEGGEEKDDEEMFRP